MPLMSAEELTSHPKYKQLLDSLTQDDLPALPTPPGEYAEDWRTHISMHGNPHNPLERQPGDPIDNEELSLVGDTFLKYQLTKLLRGDDCLRTGALTTIKGALEGNKTLARLASLYGMPAQLRAHGNIDDLRANERIQADLFEAFVGSLCSDGSTGESLAAGWLEDLYAELIERTTEITRDAFYSPENPAVSATSSSLIAAEKPILIGGLPGVSRLTEWTVQEGVKTGIKPPISFEINQDAGTPSNKPSFTGVLRIGNKTVGSSVTGPKKKLVEHQLAHNAMIEIGLTQKLH